MQTRSGGKVGPCFPNRRVEANARQHAGSVVARHIECSLMPTDQVEKATVRNFNSFWGSRGPGGVDHICEVRGLRAVFAALARLPRNALKWNYFEFLVVRKILHELLVRDEQRDTRVSQ